MEPTGIFVGTWDTSAFKAMSCAKGGKTRKQTNLYFSLINRKLATQNFLFNQHIHFKRKKDRTVPMGSTLSV
jgi:hypothetical protein